MEEQLIWTYDITWEFTLYINILSHWKQGTIYWSVNVNTDYTKAL